MTFADHVIKKVFVDLEHFLQKVAALDVFENLMFNYGIKIGLPDGLLLNFISIVSEFNDGLNSLLKEQSHQQRNREVFSVTNTQNIKCEDTIVKQEESCQDIPLVLSFCNDGSDDKSLELIGIPIANDDEQQDHRAVCDVSDTEKTDIMICKTEENEFPDALDEIEEQNTDLENLTEQQNKSQEEENVKSNVENESQNKNICETCGRKFSNSPKLVGHLVKCPKAKIKSRSDGVVHKCSVCEMTFASLRLLNSHLVQNHEKEDSNLQPSDDPMLYRVVEVQSLPENLPFYCCKTCLFVYKTPVDFEAHSCKEISDTTESGGYMGDYFHLLGKYLISNPDLLARMRKFRCGTCCEEYRSLSRMLYHLLRCTQGPYSCELCGLECASKRELNAHKRKNHRDANCFFCDECGVAFKLRASLQKHKVNRHERQADTTCDQCNLTFSKRILLTNHMIREHQAERKFLCQVCGKKFSTHGSLTAHLTSHSETLKFTCSYCNKKFRQKEKLKFHTRIHTGERPHLCPTCGKGFIRKSKLDDHMRRHRGEKQYRCSVCSKCYASSWDLKLHMKKQHSDNNSSAVTPPVTAVQTIETIPPQTETEEPAEGTTAVSTTTGLLSAEEATETMRQECAIIPDLPEETALSQLTELPLAATEPPVVDTIAPSEGKLVVQLEPTQVTNALMQTADNAVGTRLLLQLGQNGDASSRILVQLDAGQVAAASGQTALLHPSTILTVADTLQLTPVVDELNLNLSTVPAQYLQLAATPGTCGSDSAASASTAAAAVPVHIQLPVSAMSIPATALSQPATNGTTPYGLQPMPVQAVFTPTGFNVNGISY